MNLTPIFAFHFIYKMNFDRERLLHVAEKYGTPLYVYDAETIKAQ
jgi:diaminopimelate decarboxylase